MRHHSIIHIYFIYFLGRFFSDWFLILFIVSPFKPEYTITTIFVIWSQQRIWFITPRVHWSMNSDVRAQSIRKFVLFEKRQSDSNNLEKTNLLWKTYSRLPDLYLAVIIIGTIMNEPLQWFAHNSSINTVHIWLISIQLSSTDDTTQKLLPPSLSPPALPPSPPLSLPPSLSHHWSILPYE